MSDLVNKVIGLREYGILNRWDAKQQHEAFEQFLAYYEQHKKQTGTYKYLKDDEYHQKMKERLGYCWEKTIKYMENYKR